MFEHDDDPVLRRLMAEEQAVLDATELIAQALEHLGIAKSELARRLGVGPSEVTHRLRGRNLTVKSLAATLDALDHDLVLRAKPRRSPGVTLSSAAPSFAYVSHSALRVKPTTSYGLRRSAAMNDLLSGSDASGPSATSARVTV